VVTANTGAASIASIAANTTTDFAPAVNVTTAWNLTAVPGALVGYFGTPSQALSDAGTNYIASSRGGRIARRLPAVTAAAVGGAGVAGGSLALFSQALGALPGAARTTSTFASPYRPAAPAAGTIPAR
jgi:hypothetical protein